MTDKPIKAPQDCATMADIRDGIDALDRQIAAILATRQQYVEQAGIIKPNRDEVRDEARVEDVVSKAQAAIKAAGGSPDLAEATWRPMIEWFIAHEFNVFDGK
ncbi:MAG: chorismate mutase [Alphaproteobacteria bacterium]